MNTLLGLIFHSIGGFSSGSFYMPFKKIKDWPWENFWLLGGLFSWLIAPPLAAFLTIPDFGSIIANADLSIKGFTFLMGLLWGIGGLTYGLGVRYLGMSLGNSIVLGFCSAFGALVPAIYYDLAGVSGKTSFTDLLASSKGQIVLAGVLLCLVGIGIMGKAGTLKDQKDNTGEFDLKKGLIIAILSGILSSFFNFGIETGKPMAEAAVEQGCNPLFQNNVSYVVLLWGGLLTNLIWCVLLFFKNHTFGEYKKGPVSKNILLSALGGTMWFLQFFFYGMGESKLGNGASSWILHMATIILTANLWGLYLGEWRNVSQNAKRTFIIGLCCIFGSIILVGIGNS